MPRVFAIALGFLLLGEVAQGAVAESLGALQARLNAEINDPHFAEAEWGVDAVSLDTGKKVFAHNAGKLLKPASNTKLYTTALSLERLGPQYRIRTSFYAAARPDADGVLHGDLIVYGRGDPSLSARFNNDDYGKAMEPVLHALAAAGIKKVEGNLVGDDSYFRGPEYGSDWTWDDLQNYYGAPASALSFQDNVIDLVFKPGAAVGAPCRVVTMPETSFMVFHNRSTTGPAGSRSRIRLYRPLDTDATYVWGEVALGEEGETDSVAVAHPALWFVTQLKQELARRGVVVAGEVRAMDWLARETNPLPLDKLVEVASVESRPLAEIVRQTLKPSENLYAQLLLLQVGARSATAPAGRETQGAGISELYNFLRQAGIDHHNAVIQEGSGLSRGCLVTPAATVQLLTFMNHHRYRQAYIDALPIAGVDGTLRNRFKGTPAAGNVHAKTGSLGYVNALSGFLTTAGHERLVFSIMLNNYGGENGEFGGRAAIDRLVLGLVEFAGRSNSP